MASNYYGLNEDHSDDEFSSSGGYFRTIFRCYSTAFSVDFDRKSVDNGGKILLPQTVLEELIDHTTIMLFKLQNPKSKRLTHCGVLEFLQTTEPCCYLPFWMMQYLSLNEGDEILIESVHTLPPATYVRFQPQTKDFLELTNPKAVLEHVLRSFSCLTKGDIITISYLNHNYALAVLELKPANAVSIIECDMEVDFAPSADSTEEKSSTTHTNQQSNKNSSVLIRFHANGVRLNGKVTSKDKEQQNNLEISQKRGVPNYNYKHGLLQFPRIPLRSVNDEIDEILEKNSSNVFQPFTGEGKNLRQPRKQQPK